MSWPVEEYLEERSLELSPTTISGYRWILRDAERRLGSEPLAEKTSRSRSTRTGTSSTTATGPSASTGALSGLTRRDLLGLAAAWSHNNRNLSCLRGFLMWLHHPLAAHVPKGRTPAPKRERIWYTIAELEAIVEACSTPRERLLIHLACELMMRRIEIVRLRREDFLETGIRVTGKGRYGGKVRVIPYHPYTRILLASFAGDGGSSRARRTADSSLFETNRGQSGPKMSSSVRSARSGSSNSSRRTSPTTRTPPTSLLGLRRSGLDKILKGIEETLRWEGVRLSLEFHALRRTGGRLYVDAGVAAGKKPLQVLNELRGIYGHEDLRTTIWYIGWELGDAAETMTHMPLLDGKRGDRRDLRPELETQGRAPPGRP
jgi:integrase